MRLEVRARLKYDKKRTNERKDLICLGPNPYGFACNDSFVSNTPLRTSSARPRSHSFVYLCCDGAGLRSGSQSPLKPLKIDPKILQLARPLKLIPDAALPSILCHSRDGPCGSPCCGPCPVGYGVTNDGSLLKSNVADGGCWARVSKPLSSTRRVR